MRGFENHRVTPKHSDLFHNLAEPLHRVVDFDFLGLTLYESLRNIVRVQVLEKRQPAAGGLPPGTELPANGSLAGWVCMNQQPGVTSDVQKETRFPRAMQIWRENGVRSLCMLPLTTPTRRIGALCFGAGQSKLYDSTDLEFLSTLTG